MSAPPATRSVADALTWLAVLCLMLSLSALRSHRQNEQPQPTNWGARKTEWRVPELQAETLPGDDEATREAKREAMRVDYDRRLASALSAGRRLPDTRFVRWLHVPKTGTSFVNTLVRWGCPDAQRDLFVVPQKERPRELRLVFEKTFSWDWLFTNASGREWLRRHCEGRLVTTHPDKLEPHFALYMHRALRRWEIPVAVAVFRLPLQRTYSNYLHLNLHYNESRKPREPLAAFLKKPQFWSQQTKLLLGRHYRDERVVSAQEALRAAHIVVKRLQFVGLTEEFELSSRLFHAKFGGIPHQAQFENIRPGISRYQTTEGRSSSFRYNESQFNGWRDPADHIVYGAARGRFWKEVKEMKNEIELDGLGEVVIKTEHLKA